MQRAHVALRHDASLMWLIAMASNLSNGPTITAALKIAQLTSALPYRYRTVNLTYKIAALQL